MIEDKILAWLQRRQNMRRFDTPNPTFQDCMAFMFVLAKRVDRIEMKIKSFSPESIRKVIEDDIRSGGRVREVVKNA